MTTTQIHALYHAAIAADDAYAAEVARVTGGRRTRWELTPAEREATAPALAAKCAAFDAWQAASRRAAEDAAEDAGQRWAADGERGGPRCVW